MRRSLLTRSFVNFAASNCVGVSDFSGSPLPDGLFSLSLLSLRKMVLKASLMVCDALRLPVSVLIDDVVERIVSLDVRDLPQEPSDLRAGGVFTFDSTGARGT